MAKQLGDAGAIFGEHLPRSVGRSVGHAAPQSQSRPGDIRTERAAAAAALPLLPLFLAGEESRGRAGATGGRGGGGGRRQRATNGRRSRRRRPKSNDGSLRERGERDGRTGGGACKPRNSTVECRIRAGREGPTRVRERDISPGWTECMHTRKRRNFRGHQKQEEGS